MIMDQNSRVHIGLLDLTQKRGHATVKHQHELCSSGYVTLGLINVPAG
jgi:hypothetical protein